MCYNNSQKAKLKEIAKRYGKQMDIIEAWETVLEERKMKGEKVVDNIEESRHISAFVAPTCTVVTDNSELQAMQWGIIPSMTKDLKERDKYVKGNWFRNARADDVFKTWPYRYLISRNRCIFPSTGYYEYHHNADKTTTLYYIYLKNDVIFSLAGIWDVWENPVTKEQLHSFSVITTDANKLTAEIHNGGKFPHRMPLILDRENEDMWTNLNLNDVKIKSLLKVYGDENMDAYPVSKDFGERIEIEESKRLSFER